MFIYIKSADHLNAFLSLSEVERNALSWIAFATFDWLPSDPERFQILMDSLAQCNSVKRITVEEIIGVHDGLNDMFDVNFQKFCNMLTQCHALQTLEFSKSRLFFKLDAPHFVVLGKALAQCPALQTIDLKGNNLGNRNITWFDAFCNAFTQC